MAHPVKLQQEPLAQLVEHLTFNQGVEGSSPSWLTFIITCACGGMADAPDLGSGVSRRGGSSPFTRTTYCGRGSAVEHRLAKARVAGSIPVVRSIIFAPLAQLDRAFDYESKGREFESLRARHILTSYFAGVAEWQTRSTQNREGNRGGSSPLAGIN